MRTTAVSSVSRVGVATVLWAALVLAPVSAQLPTLTEIPLTDDLIGSRAGGGPEAVASDGTYVWVAEQFADTVTCLDRLTGLRLVAFAVGNLPVALLAIGSPPWPANIERDTLTKLRTSDG